MQRFDLIQRMVFSEDARAIEVVQADPLLRRLCNVLDFIKAYGNPQRSSDLIVLIKQALLSCDLTQGEHLRVPLKIGWPGTKEWQNFGFDVAAAGVEALLVQVSPWKPPWLDSGAPRVVADAIQRLHRRPDRRTPADPFIESKLDTPSYLSTSQRTAVQMAFLMPPGSTGLIVLPTGSGKSLVFQSPVFSSAFQIGLSVVVVPTVALARDQDMRFKELSARLLSAAGTFAYHSGMSVEDRGTTRKLIEEGKVRVLFASPESLMTSLRQSLFKAAAQGLLNYFAVDEAHMVSQWGESFRPEFQMLAGLRDSLRDACPKDRKFRTLLLTATMTADCYETLWSLFGIGEFRVVGDASLRSEIGFLIRNAANEKERELCIEEALRELPRPLILYTTKRDDAARWYAQICNLGFQRVALVRGGDLSDQEGDQILRDWNSGQTDIIVATSAFGLGVDQSEVRSVIHACLPESIDRFYQEVGRSGRDGRASVSLLITTPDDERLASDLAIQARIGIDRGFQRWQEMSIHGRGGPDGTYIVSLNRRPHDIDYAGPRNASWNLRTLLLMRRARLLDFRPHLPPHLERETDETDDSYQERQRLELDHFSSEVAIKLIDPGHSDRQVWDASVASARTSLRQGELQALSRTKELLALARPLNDVFVETYTVPRLGLSPKHFNGNCPVSRDRDDVEYEAGPLAECLVQPSLSLRLASTFSSSLSSCRDEGGRYWILTEALPTQSLKRRSALRQLTDFVGLCISAGVDVVSLPMALRRDLDWASLNGRSLSGFVATSEVGQVLHSDFSIPTLSYVAEDVIDSELIAAVMSLPVPANIILFTSTAPDPRNTARRLVDVVSYLPLGSAISRLQS